MLSTDSCEATARNDWGGSLLGLNAETLKGYVEWLANNRLASLGYKKIFETINWLCNYAMSASNNEGADMLRAGAGGLIGENTARLGFTAATGMVRNPMLEMIYKSPNFRSFQFDFTFYPRDEMEALEAQRILERFRYHQAPEILAGTGGFLVPPSEFDIKFYYAGRENPNIPQIATCVLTQLDVNYAPNGFAAYETPGENNPALGRTGMPVAIQFTMQFQEVTYLTKADFRKDLANSTTLARGN